MRSIHLPAAGPGGALSRGLHSAWMVILALSPLAYFGATLIEGRLPHDPKFTSVGLDNAIAAARSFAQGLGMDTRDWVAGSSITARNTTAAIFRYARVPAAGMFPKALERIAAPATVDVLLSGGTPRRWIRVNVTPAGRVIGFVTSPPERKGDPPAEATARGIAYDFLVHFLGSDSPFRLEDPKIRYADKQGWERDFYWSAEIPGLPRVKARFHVDLVGTQVISLTPSLQLDPAFQKQLQPSGTWSTILGWTMGIYYFGFGLYTIYRYVRRSIEREVSHRRTLLVGLALLATGLIATGMNGNDASVSIGNDPATGIKAILVLSLGLGVVGLVFGVAYAAGEGDLREAYPGKLCSVDAFLSGKWLSANCARSILAGGAFAGWLLLIQNALLLVAPGGPVGDAAELAANALHKSPVADGIGDVLSNVLIMTAFGLMLPLTVLHSRIRDQRLLWALLVPTSALVAVAAAPAGHSWQQKLILEAAYPAAALAPFFFGDLLAAVSSLTALAFGGTLLRKSEFSDQWHTVAYHQVLPAGIVFLLVEMWFAWRGRIYSEAQVRPLYAKHLAERLALTAEMGAARLAQVRLLPDAPPRITGLSIAGSCTPAREVGGDFFDYFVLDDHRLGIFVAEGGSRELASAMAIALAKGFLLYTVRLDLTPVEILRRLRATLAAVLRGENAPMAVVYAVVDGRNRTLRYARAGTSPRVVVNGNALAEEIVSDGAGNLAIEIRHGAATLAPHDALFIYTDGWAGQIAERTRRVPDEFLRKLAREHPGVAAEELHKAALDAAVKRRREAPSDDVTAVVVRLEEMAAAAAEGIA